jgi:hypothetical protein
MAEFCGFKWTTKYKRKENILQELSKHFQKIFKQHASRFRLNFVKILKMYLQVKYWEVNKEVIYTLQTTLTIHVNYQN